MNEGTFESGFTTETGGIILPQGKHMESSSYVTYYDLPKYTIYFYMAYFVPQGGKLRIILPVDI